MINILISKILFFEQRSPLKCHRRPSWGQTLFLRRSSLPMIRSAATSAHVESKQRVRPAPKHTPSLPQKHSLPPRGLSRCTAPKHRFRMPQNAVFVPQKTPLATVCHGMRHAWISSATAHRRTPYRSALPSTVLPPQRAAHIATNDRYAIFASYIRKSNIFTPLLYCCHVLCYNSGRCPACTPSQSRANINTGAIGIFYHLYT